MKQTTTKPAAVPLDAALMHDLKAFKEREQLTSAQLARRMGVSEAYVSRAFKGTFNGHVPDFEDKARAMMQAAERARYKPLITVSPTGFLVEPMRQFLAAVQHTGDIGVAWGKAGYGKTCGITVYRDNDPLSIVVTALQSLKGWRSIRNAILKQLPSTRRQQGESIDEFLQRTFRGSRRLLVIDNAHLLTESARHWLSYDWNEQTGCPVALVGNPEIVKQWERNDQHQSRVGIAYAVKAEKSLTASDVARATLELILPEAASDARTLELAARVVTAKGASRSLRKHAELMRELMQSKEFKSMPLCDVFRAANRMLLSDANLEVAA